MVYWFLSKSMKQMEQFSMFANPVTKFLLTSIFYCYSSIGSKLHVQFASKLAIVTLSAELVLVNHFLAKQLSEQKKHGKKNNTKMIITIM